MSLSILVAAGGTGGHMIPADALATELRRRGHRVTLLTDDRGLRFPGLFEGVEKHVVESASVRPANPIAALKGICAIVKGRRAAKRIAKDVAANAVVGFGGYPSLPGILAGTTLRLPCILHEQNAVLGRSNRSLQGHVSAIALSFRNTERLSPAGERKAQFTGNPVRAAILRGRDAPFRAPAGAAPFQLLVIGGSQGAHILSELVPAAIEKLAPAEQQRLRIVQQCRAEDLSAVSVRYQQLGLDVDLTTYFADLPQRLQQAHLVIARAGASTMAELTAMGRPAILIPYAAATDDHQTANASGFIAAGAGLLLPEREANGARLCGMLRGFMESPEALSGAAQAARGIGVPDATAKLADLIEQEVRAQ